VLRQRVDVLGEGVAHLGLARHLLAIALDRNRVLTVNGQQGVEQCIAIAAAVQQWRQSASSAALIPGSFVDSVASSGSWYSWRE
jgi:hypothetical protein